MKINFYLTNHFNKADESLIRCVISIRGTRLQKTMGIYVLPDKWDEARQKVKQGYTNRAGQDYRYINSKISNLQKQFTDFDLSISDKPTEMDMRVQFEKAMSVTPEKVTVEKVIEKMEPKVKVPSTLERIDEFLKECSITNGWSEASYKMLKSFKKHIEKFGKAKTPEFFDQDGLNRFIIYLREDAGLEESSAKKQYKNLLWFMNWAIRKGYTKEITIQNYKPKFNLVAKPVIFLNKEELLKLYHYEIPANGEKVTLTDLNGNEYEKTIKEAGGMAKARDLFCFCAFTSLRYSDMAQLHRCDIRNNSIYITTQKTHDSLIIQLSPQAEEILRKYENQHFPMDLALPVQTNQEMNRYLKDLCELCGFNTPIRQVCYRNNKREEDIVPKWSLITTHCGRKTFICFALASGIPPQVVMKWTGHCDYKSMKPYIDIAEKSKEDAMKKIGAAWAE